MNTLKVSSKLFTLGCIIALWIGSGTVADAQPIPGFYYGLFYPTNGIAHENSGLIIVKATPTSTFLAKVFLEGQPRGMTIKTIPGSKTIIRTNQGRENVLVSLLSSPNPDQIDGTISNSSWIANFSVLRNPWSALNPATAFAGNYNIIIPGHTNATEAPAGDGAVAVYARTDGRTAAGGFSGDGQILHTFLSGLSATGDLPFYVPMYSSLRSVTNGATVSLVRVFDGSMIGSVSFNGNSNAPQGTIVWTKKGSTNGFYDNGFTNVITLLSSRYTHPQVNSRVLNITNGLLTLKDGNLPETITNGFLLETNNRVYMSASTNPIKIAVSLGKGLVTGVFTNPANTTIRTKIRGAVLQDQNVIRGNFLGTNQSGSLLMEAQ